MNVNNTEMNLELICYKKIIDCFLKNKNKSNKLQMCKNKSIIRLMEISQSRNARYLAQNGLILVLSLFDDIPPDLFSALGDDIKSLMDDNEKERLVSELKKEFAS